MIKLKGIREQAIKNTAYTMLARAQTAPKATDVDNLFYAIIERNEIKEVVKTMQDLAYKNDVPFFYRDAQNIANLPYIVILGVIKGENYTPYNSQLINATYFDLTTLGIAIGSALEAANQNGIDTRVMWSIGEGFVHSGLASEELSIAYGIPLSLSKKNPFNDRQTV